MIKNLIRFFLILFITFTLFSETVSQDDYFIVTSTFGDFRGDHFHTGIDIAAEEGTPIYASEKEEVIFFTKKRPNNPHYGLGDFVVTFSLESQKQRIYSHIKKDSYLDSITTFHNNEEIAQIGNTGHSTGAHLHYEEKNIPKSRILNPISTITFKDTLKPRIIDAYLKYPDDTIQSLYDYSTASIKRNSSLYIKCYDSINGSKYYVSPYKITVFVDGNVKSLLQFDYLEYNDNNLTVSNTSLTVDDIYANNTDFDYYLTDFAFLPGLIGLRIVVEDYFGNSEIYKRTVRVTK